LPPASARRARPSFPTRRLPIFSIAQVSGRPVKFASTGERLDAFEPFHPDRLASRILGMGDILTLIEKSEEAFEEDERKSVRMERDRKSARLNYSHVKISYAGDC